MAIFYIHTICTQYGYETKEFVEEYYAANKGLIGGPLMSDAEKLKQVIWHNFHCQ